MDIKTTLLALFLGSQLLIPLSYYFGGTNKYDAYDERFAWRMFSPVRMLRCDGSFSRDGKAISLGSSYHMTWSTLFKRGRPDVLRALAKDLCEESTSSTVSLTFQCREADGTIVKLEDGTANLCKGEGSFQ